MQIDSEYVDNAEERAEEITIRGGKSPDKTPEILRKYSGNTLEMLRKYSGKYT